MKRDLTPSVSVEDQSELLVKHGSELLDLVIRLVEAAYEKGWADCEEQWTAYADTLETPVARA